MARIRSLTCAIVIPSVSIEDKDHVRLEYHRSLLPVPASGSGANAADINFVPLARYCLRIDRRIVQTQH